MIYLCLLKISMIFRQKIKDLLYRLRKLIISSSFRPYILYLEHFWKPKNFLEKLLMDFFEENRERFFVQVGANDGFVNDPVYRYVKKYRLEGIVLEPQMIPYDVLKDIYDKDKVKVLNYAVDRINGYRNIYKLSFSDDRWATGISSFDHQHLEKLINSGFVEKKALKYGIKLPADKNDWITAEEVESLNFQTIFESLEVENVNLLMVDTEGFDHEIIKIFDFEKYKPEIVVFEKMHLKDSDYYQCKELLLNHGYRLREEGPNCIALHQSYKFRL